MTFLKTAIPVMFLMYATSASYGQVQDSDTTEVVNLEGTVFTAEKKPVIYRLGKKDCQRLVIAVCVRRLRRGHT